MKLLAHILYRGAEIPVSGVWWNSHRSALHLNPSLRRMKRGLLPALKTTGVTKKKYIHLNIPKTSDFAVRIQIEDFYTPIDLLIISEADSLRACEDFGNVSGDSS